MFELCSKLTELDLSSWNTVSLTNIQEIFYQCTKLENLNLSGWDTSDVTNMVLAFYCCGNMATVNLSGWDTSKVADMRSMFERGSIKEITLSPQFSFDGKGNIYSKAILPAPSSQYPYTGKWISESEVYGPYTSSELQAKYSPEMAGTWVWEEVPVNYKIVFLPPDNENYGGSMPVQKIKAAEQGTISGNAFFRFNYHFVYWSGDNGRTYTDKQVIPANTMNYPAACCGVVHCKECL